MIKLTIEELKPGMVLAHPVRNHQGVLLLDEGARISKKNIRIFKSWGVVEVSIKGNSAAAMDHSGDTESKVKESIEKQLKAKFADVLDDPVMIEIFKAASKQLIKDSQNLEGENEPS